MGFILKDESELRSDPKSARKRAALLATPFAVMGIVALAGFIHDGLIVGGLDRKKGFELLSMIAASIGFVALIFGISAKREAIKSAGLKSEGDEKPWLRRKDWTDGRLRSTSKKPFFLLWIFVFFWCFGSAAISLVVVPWQWHQGNRAVLVALVIPVIGLALIIFAVWTTLAWRRLGRTIFEMPVLPAAAGGALTGQIRILGTLRPEHGWYVALSCIRRKTTGPANNLRTNERVLWRDETWLRPDLPQAQAAQTTIPVFFRLPQDKPESTPAMGDGTHWRLEAWARLSGPDFYTAFEVPVFKVAEQPEIPENLAAQYQLSLDEIRKEIQSNIQITDLPDSKEFVFPGGRVPGFAAGATVVCLIWTAIVVLLVIYRAPIPLPLVFGAMDLLMLFFVFDLWFRRSRLLVSAGTVTIETIWPGYKKELSVKNADLAEFAAEIGATVGHAAYYDLKLRARDGKEWTLAKNLNHKPEADWLARQIAAAAARTSAKDVKA
ncbi:MAG TPA: hypothetical protein VNV43_11175 [Candidatus Acidoferrales bacterium]|nr:hypothetical protein [Candidatus Acidoferrales bacterium]